MYCFESTFLNWKEKFEPNAVMSPPQVKEASVNDAKITPDTIGISAIMLISEGIDPRSQAEKTAVKNGSKALIVCVKDTATDPRLAFVKRNPRRCSTPRGRTCKTVARLGFGAFFSLSPHMTSMQSDPTDKCIKVHTAGYGNAFNTLLLNTLKYTLNTYHPPKRAPNPSVLKGMFKRLTDLCTVFARTRAMSDPLKRLVFRLNLDDEAFETAWAPFVSTPSPLASSSSFAFSGVWSRSVSAAHLTILRVLLSSQSFSLSPLLSFLQVACAGADTCKHLVLVLVPDPVPAPPSLTLTTLALALALQHAPKFPGPEGRVTILAVFSITTRNARSLAHLTLSLAQPRCPAPKERDEMVTLCNEDELSRARKPRTQRISVHLTA